MLKISKKIVFSLLLALAVGVMFMACNDHDPIPIDPEEPDNPQIEEDTLAPKYLWFDASANFERFSHIDSIRYYLDKSKDVGITDIVVDVRPVCGDVLYKSTTVDELLDWKGYKRNISWDYLDTFIKECRERNLRIHAALNVFSGGHNYFDAGIVYRDSEMGKRTTLLNKPTGMIDIKTIKSQYSAFFNPADPVVQEYCLSIIKEVAGKYDVDGIILDRCRFDGIDSDFSQTSRDLFEDYIGQKLTAFPDDIFKWVKLSDGSWGRHPGNLYTTWLEWRAKIIHDFFELAKNEVKALKSDIKFGTYTGAWYPTYYFVGANWASKNYDPKSDNFENWMYTLKYKDFGYADHLDIYMTGVYYPTLYGDGWSCIEGGLDHAKRITMGDVPVTGGLYVDVYKNKPEDFSTAVYLCLKKSEGLMVFDIVHLIMYDYWDELKQGIINGEN